MKDKREFNYNMNASNDSNAFISSLDSFSSADIKCAPDNEKIKTLLPLILRSVVMAISFAIFCYSAYAIMARITEDKEQNKLLESLHPTLAESELKKPVEMNEPNKMPTLLEMIEANGVYNEYLNEKKVDPRTLDYFRESFNNSAKQNSDTFGWIFFRGTEAFTEKGIDYPIFIGDNEYYLTHDYLGNKVKRGSIFAEESLNTDFDANLNVLLYGHCMSDGSMFRPIKLWYDSANRNTLAKEMQIEIYNADGVYIYDLFSSYRSDDFNFTKVTYSSEKDYKNFLDDIYKRSVLNKKVSYSADSKICTLITCTNVQTNQDERYVVHGILRQFIPYE